jgi:hypothetical protein
VHKGREFIVTSAEPAPEYPGPNGYERCVDPDCPFRWGDAEHGHQPQAETRPGTMLKAVQRDLEGIKVAEVPGGYTYAAIAVHLAGVIDKRGADDGPSVTAKLADQLGKAMAALTRRGGGDDDKFGEFSDSISTPVVE